LAKLLDTNKDELLTLWLAGQVYEIVKEEDVAKAAINFVKTQIR
jgi:hypothetical protein